MWLLKVSRAAFCARRNGRPGRRAVRDTEPASKITEIHAHSRGSYAAPRVHAALQQRKDRCGRRRVAGLMRQAGIEGRHRRRRHRTTIPDPTAATRPDPVLRGFRPGPTALDARRCGDTTSIPTEEGRLCPAAVIDTASRRVVGRATADHLRTEPVADALRTACHTRRPTGTVLFHPDRGCQYTGREFAHLAEEFGVRLSVGRTGRCWDNALAESFFATLKRELPGDRPWPSRGAARTAIFEWIEGWYNLRRLHSSPGHRSPAEHENALAARPTHQGRPPERSKLTPRLHPRAAGADPKGRGLQAVVADVPDRDAAGTRKASTRPCTKAS
ncbi:IS3 family transposase [Kitasatospora sp. NPDC057198]|uniref:IS3 family transposase n=1 Tax=Kitasatospora sp. NPDC057198 TaxID=3346046 RepID=UPI0036445D21